MSVLSEIDPDFTPEWAYGEPHSRAGFKTDPEDFQVFEDLGYEPTGEGEHLFLYIRKRGANTAFVARKLSEYLKVPARQISFAGMKDRHAVTEQWFAVHLPGKAEPDFTAFNTDEMTVLTAVRHNRKLRRGNLRGNRFHIRLRQVTDRSETEQRLQQIIHGVPNYYGEQRFGHQGRNISAAERMFASKRPPRDRNKRSIYLSAARSYLFNQLLSQRVSAGNWQHPLTGECFLLGLSSSFFSEPAMTEALSERFRKGEIRLSGPLWGRGDLTSQGLVADLEMKALEPFVLFCAGLEKAGLKQERRALALIPDAFHCEWKGDDLWLDFWLPSGCFATSILRELIKLDEPEDTGANITVTPGGK